MGKDSPPPPPDYSPFANASMAASVSDAHAADLQYQLGQRQLDLQQQYAAKSAETGDTYLRMAQDAQQWGRDQFNLVWPYAQNYLQSQQALSNLAGENASEAVLAARQQRQEATDTYNRYMSTFAPIEQQFAQTALGYNTPERAAQASAAAQADVSSQFAQQEQAREAQLRSYSIDPSQARYQGETAIAGLQAAAARAAAGTQARRAQELTGLGLTQQAIAVGQKLPTVALGQIEAATGSAGGGLQAGQYGGGGIQQANALLGTGVQAGGSPVGYAYLSNPYTSLSGAAGSVGAGLFGGGNTALGNQASALGQGISALSTGFNNQMSNFNAQQQQQQALWGGIGKVAGLGVSLALAPMTGGGSLFGNLMGGGGWGGSSFA
jgi:hypothetical protein